MTASGRIHTARVYKNLNYNKDAEVECDPLFQEAYETWKQGQDAMDTRLQQQHQEYLSHGKPKRSIERVNYKE